MLFRSKGKYLVNPQFDNVNQRIEGLFYITSDYYDASAFIGLFFKKAGDNSFDGFTSTSTLQNIVDNPIYSNLNADSQFLAYTMDDQIMTKDILITSTRFHFSNPIFENITTYSNYYGYSYETGSSKQFKFSEIVSAIEYNFDFSNEAEEKGGSIASALKREIESRFSLNMEIKENQYVALQENKFSFAIFYDDTHCSIIIAFNKAKLQDILNKKMTEEELGGD